MKGQVYQFRRMLVLRRSASAEKRVGDGRTEWNGIEWDAISLVSLREGELLACSQRKSGLKGMALPIYMDFWVAKGGLNTMK